MKHADHADEQTSTMTTTKLAQHPTLDAVAHHEAGHALVGSMHFGNVGRVTIVPGPDGLTLGRAMTERMYLSPEWVRRLLASDPEGNVAHARATVHCGVRLCLAGHVAESIHTGRPWVMCDDDDVRGALEWIEAGYPGDREFGRWLIIDRERRRLRDWLREHWQHVGALARELLQRSTLTGDEVMEIILRQPRIRIPMYAEDRALTAAHAAKSHG